MDERTGIHALLCLWPYVLVISSVINIYLVGDVLSLTLFWRISSYPQWCSCCMSEWHSDTIQATLFMCCASVTLVRGGWKTVWDGFMA